MVLRLRMLITHDWKEILVCQHKSLNENKVKFANDNTLVSEGISGVLIMRKYGKRLVVSNVFYIPYMKSNLLSIWRLIENNYKVLIEDKMMRVLNSGGRLILNTLVSHNKTLKIELNMIEHKCLETAASRDE